MTPYSGDGANAYVQVGNKVNAGVNAGFPQTCLKHHLGKFGMSGGLWWVDTDVLLIVWPWE